MLAKQNQKDQVLYTLKTIHDELDTRLRQVDPTLEDFEVRVRVDVAFDKTEEECHLIWTLGYSVTEGTCFSVTSSWVDYAMDEFVTCYRKQTGK